MRSAEEDQLTTCGRIIVQTHDKQRVIDDFQARFVALILRERGAEVGPDLPVLRGEDADGVSRNLEFSQCRWRDVAGKVTHFHTIGLVCIGHDSLQISQHLAFSQQRAIILVQTIEPI